MNSPSHKSDYESQAWQHLDQLTKPPRSLGRLEEIAAQLCAIQRTDNPQTMPRSVLIFAGDHGVCAEGVSAFPQSVTKEMIKNMLNGGAAVSVLSRLHSAALTVIDVGVIGSRIELPNAAGSSICAGTRNFVAEPAMTMEEMNGALETGKIYAKKEIEAGAQVLVLGEMGIGNTTPAAALACCVLNDAPAEIAGRGTGVDDAGLKRKVAAIEEGIDRHRDAVHDPYRMLACLGGFEIAALVGSVIQSAKMCVPVLLDGFIVTAAAAVAAAIEPEVKQCLIAAHVSCEPAHRRLLDHLGLKPILDLEMRLGEASGALVALPVLDAACSIFNEMATFDSAGVSKKTVE